MKRILLALTLFIILPAAHATYVPVAVTGFTDDIVANGVGSAASSTTNTADGGSGGNQFVFHDATYNGGLGTPVTYLPTGGLFTTAIAGTPGLQFQLASYSANNSLRKQSNTTGTLTFTTPQAAAELFFAGFCGNGSMPVTIIVNFTDNTTQVMASVTVSDWFNATPIALSGFGRTNRTGNNIENPSGNPRLYQYQYAILPANQSKLIQSITVNTGTSSNVTNGTLGIMAVSINTPASVNVTPSALSTCGGSNITFTANVTGTNSGTLSYQWKKNGNNVGTNSPTFITPITSSTDAYTVSVTNSNSTFAPALVTSSPVSVTLIAPLAAPVSISGPTSVCAYGPNTYTIPAIPNTTGYIWSLPSGWTAPTLNTTTIVATAGAAGGNITVSGVNVCGAGPTASLAVSVVGSVVPTASISFPSGLICISTNVLFTSSVTNGGTAPTYQWKRNNVNVGTNNPTYTGTGFINGDIVTLQITSSAGCAIPATVMSNVLTVPVTTIPATPSSISGPTPICLNTTNTYSVTALTNATSYNWTLPNGWTGTSATNSISATAGSTGGSVQVTATNVCGTSPVQSLPVVVNAPAPAITFNHSPSGIPCSGTNITFSAVYVDGGTTPSFQWKRNGQNVGTNSPTYVTSSLINGDAISVVLTSNATCTNVTTVASTVQNIQLNPTQAPGININSIPLSSICQGAELNLTSNIVGGGPNPMYQWFKNGNPISGATGASYVSRGFVNNDTMRVEMTTSAQCSSTPTTWSNTLIVHVDPSVVPAVTVSSSAGQMISVGQTVTFTANLLHPGLNPAIQWSRNGQDIQGATQPSYTTSAISNGDMFGVTLISDAPCAIPRVVKTSGLMMQVANGIASVPSQTGISLWPNPNNGTFTLSGKSNTNQTVKLEALNVTGQRVWSQDLQPSTTNWVKSISLDKNLPSGLYFLRVSTSDHLSVLVFEIDN